MLYRLAADLLVIIHLFFIIFVVSGGLLVRRWPGLLFVHIPAAVWGALVEFQGWICPLTPLEQQLRRSSGQFPYHGGFVELYVEPIIYPAGLTREMQITLGCIVLVINLVAYGWLLVDLTRGKKKEGSTGKKQRR